MSREIIQHGRVIAVEATAPGEVDMIAVPADWRADRDILVPAPFLLSCRGASCHAYDATEDRAKAEAAGWADIEFDPTGESWNYLGLCPECAAEAREGAGR